MQPAQPSREIFRSQYICNTDIQRLNLTDSEIELYGEGLFSIPGDSSAPTSAAMGFFTWRSTINNLINFSGDSDSKL